METGRIKAMINKALGSVRQGIRGKLLRSDASKRVMLVQAEGVNGETLNGVEFFQQPGIRSIPLEGMQVIIIPLNGVSANGVVVSMSNGTAHVAGLQPGEVAVFNEKDGQYNSIVLKNGKLIEVTCEQLTINASVGVNINTPQVGVTGDVVAGGKSLIHHTHIAMGSPTSQPV